MSSLRPIWLVEDSVEDVELTLAALETIHLANRVVVMRDGSEALERLQSPMEADSLPAVIMLDIKMPKVSGIEVLGHIKGDPELKNLPVVMLTSSRQSPDVAECYKLGANAYVVKPVESMAFFDAVKTAGKFWAIVNERPELGKGTEGWAVVNERPELGKGTEGWAVVNERPEPGKSAEGYDAHPAGK